MQCLCYKRPTRRETSRKFTSGSLCKDCEWEIKIRFSQNKTRRINSGISEEKNKSFPVVANVTTRHVYWMKNRIKSILPEIHECDSQDFVNMFNTSKLPIGIDNQPFSDDNIV